MLKRQRPASPPHSVPEASLLSDSPSFDMPHREMKRRRTQPPVLDGPSRGWGLGHPTNPSDDESYDDDGEDGEEDDEHEFIPSASRRTRNHASPGPHSSQDSEYKKANSVLYELHAVHRHRLLFPPSQLSSSSDVSKPVTYPASSASDRSETQPSAYMRRLEKVEISSHAPTPRHGDPELEGVKQRYEDTNRLLGSLFLSRLRERQSIEDTGP